MTHDEAIDAICGVLGVTVLSYQEAIEGYLGLRGVADYERLSPAQGMPLREDPKGLRPKAGSPVPAAPGCALSPSNPSSPTTTKRG